jgi:radical SAM superfamily enzyme YgiQ (UPF0313 family)
MNVLLIEPNFNTSRTAPPLGIGYIAAALSKANVPTHLLDFSLLRPGRSAINPLLAQIRPAPEIVGISCYSWTYEQAKFVSEACREVFADALIVMGGAWAGHAPTLTLQEFPAVDIVVRDEGEETMVEIAQVQNGAELPKVQGISFRAGGDIIHTPPRPICLDVDTIPSPYIEGVFDMREYDTILLPMGRGCPFSCVYCSWGSPSRTGRLRYYDIDRVIEELEVAYRNGARRVLPCDGTFNASADRLQRLGEEILSRDLQFEWGDVDMRADLTSREQMQMLKRIGTAEVGFGLESKHKRTQQIIRKHLDPAALPSAMAWAKEMGFRTHMSMIVGLPGETREEVYETFAFARHCDPDRYGIFEIRLQPGTCLFKHHEEFGLRICGRTGGSFCAETDLLSINDIRGIVADLKSQIIPIESNRPKRRLTRFMNEVLG